MPTSLDTPQPPTKSTRAPQVVGGVALAIYVVFLVSSFFWDGGWISGLLKEHYVFFVGIPFAAFIAYFLVATLESAKGEIEFEALSMKFKGASGPIIMWVLVFLAFIVAIRLVWDLK